MRVVNQKSNSEIALNAKIAKGFLQRLRGLIGRKKLEEGEALWIKPCNSIHTIGMRFAIDVIFLDKDNNIIAIKKNLKPNRLTRIYLRASSVLELPAGTIDTTDTKIGDSVKIVGQK